MAELYRTVVEIAGRQHTVRSENSPAKMLQIAQEVDRRVHEVSRLQPALSLSDAVLLVALQLAVDLDGERVRSQHLATALEKEWARSD